MAYIGSLSTDVYAPKRFTISIIQNKEKKLFGIWKKWGVEKLL